MRGPQRSGGCTLEALAPEADALHHAPLTDACEAIARLRAQAAQLTAELTEANVEREALRIEVAVAAEVTVDRKQAEHVLHELRACLDLDEDAPGEVVLEAVRRVKAARIVAEERLARARHLLRCA